MKERGVHLGLLLVNGKKEKKKFIKPSNLSWYKSSIYGTAIITPQVLSLEGKA